MIYGYEINRTEHMCVCEHCMCGIESHEGKQPTVTFYADADDAAESKCDWCEETGFDTLFALL